jgi:hypothetical protein
VTWALHANVAGHGITRWPHFTNIVENKHVSVDTDHPSEEAQPRCRNGVVRISMHAYIRACRIEPVFDQFIDGYIDHASQAGSLAEAISPKSNDHFATTSTRLSGLEIPSSSRAVPSKQS